MVFASREDMGEVKLRNRNGVFEISHGPSEPDPAKPSPVIVISMPRLTSLSLRGPVQMEAGGFSSDGSFEVAIGSGGFLNLNGFEAKDARFSIEGPATLHAFLSADTIEMTSTGNSVVRIGGRAGTLLYAASGPSRLDGSLLLVDDISLDLSGPSEIRITPDVSMKVKSLDRAVIYYSDRYMEGVPDVEGNAILRKF